MRDNWGTANHHASPIIKKSSFAGSTSSFSVPSRCASANIQSCAGSEPCGRLVYDWTLGQTLPEQEPDQLRTFDMIVEDAARIFPDVLQTGSVRS